MSVSPFTFALASQVPFTVLLTSDMLFLFLLFVCRFANFQGGKLFMSFAPCPRRRPSPEKEVWYQIIWSLSKETSHAIVTAFYRSHLNSRWRHAVTFCVLVIFSLTSWFWALYSKIDQKNLFTVGKRWFASSTGHFFKECCFDFNLIHFYWPNNLTTFLGKARWPHGYSTLWPGTLCCVSWARQVILTVQCSCINGYRRI